MSDKIAKQATEAKDANNIKDPHLGWMIGFLFLVSFIGLFALVPLRKVCLQFFSPLCSYWFTVWKQTCSYQLNFVSDYDCWLQADLSKWHSHCISHQRVSHTWGSQACKVCPYSSAFGYFDLVKTISIIFTTWSMLCNSAYNDNDIFQEASKDVGQVLCV